MAYFRFFRVTLYFKDKQGDFHFTLRLEIRKWKDGLRVRFPSNVKVSQDYHDLDKTDIRDKVDFLTIVPIIAEEHEGINSGKTKFIESVLGDIKQFAVYKVDTKYSFKYKWVIRGDLVIEKGDIKIDPVINQIRYFMRLDDGVYEEEEDDDTDLEQLKEKYERLREDIKILENTRDDLYNSYTELKKYKENLEKDMTIKEEEYNQKIKELEDLQRAHDEDLNRQIDLLALQKEDLQNGYDVKIKEFEHLKLEKDELEQLLNIRIEELEKEKLTQQEQYNIKILETEKERDQLVEEKVKEIEDLEQNIQEIKERNNEISKERNELKDALAKFELTGVNISSWGNPPPKKKSRKSDDSFCYIS